jgi:hypothetical protein
MYFTKPHPFPSYLSTYRAINHKNHSFSTKKKQFQTLEKTPEQLIGEKIHQIYEHNDLTVVPIAVMYCVFNVLSYFKDFEYPFDAKSNKLRFSGFGPDKFLSQGFPIVR